MSGNWITSKAKGQASVALAAQHVGTMLQQHGRANPKHHSTIHVGNVASYTCKASPWHGSRLDFAYRDALDRQSIEMAQRSEIRIHHDTPVVSLPLADPSLAVEQWCIRGSCQMQKEEQMAGFGHSCFDLAQHAKHCLLRVAKSCFQI